MGRGLVDAVISFRYWQACNVVCLIKSHVHLLMSSWCVGLRRGFEGYQACVLVGLSRCCLLLAPMCDLKTPNWI